MEFKWVMEVRAETWLRVKSSEELASLSLLASILTFLELIQFRLETS
jgi:hypothetical protein